MLRLALDQATLEVAEEKRRNVAISFNLDHIQDELTRGKVDLDHAQYKLAQYKEDEEGH